MTPARAVPTAAALALCATQAAAETWFCEAVRAAPLPWVLHAVSDETLILRDDGRFAHDWQLVLSNDANAVLIDGAATGLWRMEDGALLLSVGRARMVSVDAFGIHGDYPKWSAEEVAALLRDLDLPAGIEALAGTERHYAAAPGAAGGMRLTEPDGAALDCVLGPPPGE